MYKDGVRNLLIYLLLLLSILACFIAYILAKRDILAPPVVFSGVFIISILVAIPNIDLWNFDMGEKTFAVLSCGIYSFCIGYFFMYFSKKKFTKRVIMYIENSKSTFISNYKLLLLFFIQIITIYLLYQTISDIAINMGGADSLTQKIYLYRKNDIMNNNEYGRLPYLVQNLLIFCKAIIYFLIYKFCEEYFILHKINKKYICIILVYIMMNFLKGSRGDNVDLIVSFCIMIYIFWLSDNKWKKVLSVKHICIICTCLVIFLILFSSVGLVMLGRGGQLGDTNIIVSIWKQISIYIGAPIKLLDLYIYSDFNTENLLSGIVTFRNLYAFLGRRFDIESWQLPTLFGYEFRIDNGQELGNVYTTFKPYLMDFGLMGVICLSFIMGMIYAFIYFSIKYKNCMYGKYKYFYLIIYSYLYTYLVKVFFVESFYKNVFSIDFIKFFIVLYIADKVFIIKNRKD